MLITDAVVPGRGRTHVLLRDGRVAGFPSHRVPDEATLAARGRTLIPGLADAHVHLLATAALANSIDARGVDQEALQARIHAQAGTGTVRITGFHGPADALLDRRVLDRWCPDRPLRLQYRTGALWVLNTAALDALPPGRTDASAFERGPDGRPTGRVWRADTLLRDATPDAQALHGLGQQLARWGVTALTDTSATTDDAQAAVLEPLLAGLPQRVQLMGNAALSPARSPHWTRGARKILLDEAVLPDLDTLCRDIAIAHAQGRCVAIHCVTPTELVFAVAAWQVQGSVPGDRVEHGALIDHATLPVLAALGLTVVTQPGFVRAHGERYLRDVPPEQHGDLYRVRSLLSAGVRVAFSSDAPYGPLNPWHNLRSALQRRTTTDVPLGPDEAVTAEQALALHAAAASDVARHAGGPQADATLCIGDAADLCLLREGVSWVDGCDDPVACTLVGGRPVYIRELQDRPAHPGAAPTADPPPAAAFVREKACP